MGLEHTGDAAQDAPSASAWGFARHSGCRRWHRFRARSLSWATEAAVGIPQSQKASPSSFCILRRGWPRRPPVGAPGSVGIDPLDPECTNALADATGQAVAGFLDDQRARQASTRRAMVSSPPEVVVAFGLHDLGPVEMDHQRVCTAGGHRPASCSEEVVAAWTMPILPSTGHWGSVTHFVGPDGQQGRWEPNAKPTRALLPRWRGHG